jgi:hypothetical protein
VVTTYFLGGAGNLLRNSRHIDDFTHKSKEYHGFAEWFFGLNLTLFPYNAVKANIYKSTIRSKGGSRTALTGDNFRYTYHLPGRERCFPFCKGIPEIFLDGKLGNLVN